MLKDKIEKPGYLLIAVLGLIAPMVFPAYVQQIAMLWIMIVFALTWDAMGGQMGYNSLGNIFFFGAGMYIAAVAQIWPWYDVGQYTDPAGALKTSFTTGQYFAGLALGVVLAAVGSVVLAVVFGLIVFGLRGPYFAIGTLGMAIAAGELIGAWDWIGGGGGIRLPVFPSGTDADPLFRVPFGAIASADLQGVFFYWSCFVLTILTFFFFRWLYTTRFGLMLNAIRDDETKSEALGVRTTLYKTVAWSMSAFFLGISGALFGNIIGFIEPLEVAFPTVTFGIFMVLMALLGGKGTLWGPVIGATLFHIIKEVTWTHLLGWQWVVLGLLIIVTVVFFQQGIVGWMQEKRPEWFGIEVDRGTAGQRADAAAADSQEAEQDGRRRGGRPMSALIEVESVSKAFGGVVANNAISMAVEEGSITGLIGPNGSGKTTLFNSIVGFHPIDEGSIRFKGQEISSMRVPQIARLGMLRTFQQTRIFKKLNCVDNMHAALSHREGRFSGMFAKKSGEAEERAEQLLDFVGLYQKRKLRAGDLSFGQQKLLEFAMALMNEPEALLLDEPTAGINPTLINGLIDRLRLANEQFGVTLFVIEHNMRVIMNLAQHIYCLAHGELLADGPPDELQNDQRVIDAYLGAH